MNVLHLIIYPSCPEGNFGGNQLLNGSMSLSPLYSSQAETICTSVPLSQASTKISPGFTMLE